MVRQGQEGDTTTTFTESSTDFLSSSRHRTGTPTVQGSNPNNRGSGVHYCMVQPQDYEIKATHRIDVLESSQHRPNAVPRLPSNHWSTTSTTRRLTNSTRIPFSPNRTLRSSSYSHKAKPLPIPSRIWRENYNYRNDSGRFLGPNRGPLTRVW